MPEMTGEMFYTPAEVAARLKVKQRTVMEWLRTGQLRGVKLGPGGRLWRVRAADLDTFAEAPAGPAGAVSRPWRRYNAREVQEFLDADRLDPETVECLERLLRG